MTFILPYITRESQGVVQDRSQGHLWWVLEFILDTPIVKFPAKLRGPRQTAFGNTHNGYPCHLSTYF